MPYIVKMQLASQAPCSSLKMCLLFNYLQGKNAETIEITGNQNYCKRLRSICQMIYQEGL